MSFSDAFTNLEKGIKDLGQLKVQTFTGNVAGAIKDGKLDLDSLLAQSNASGSNIKLVAATAVEIDGDCNCFIGEGYETSKLLETHCDAVKAGHDTRSSIINMVLSVLGKIPK